MSVDVQEIEDLLKQAFPDGIVRVENTNNDGRHYVAHVESAIFRGKTRIQQHQMVYKALKGYVGESLHALALKTAIPTKG